MQTLDSSKQKLLQSDKNLLQAGLSRPASTYGRTVTRSKSVKGSRTTGDLGNDSKRYLESINLYASLFSMAGVVVAVLREGYDISL